MSRLNNAITRCEVSEDNMVEILWRNFGTASGSEEVDLIARLSPSVSLLIPVAVPVPFFR